MTLRLSTTARNAMATAIRDLMDADVGAASLKIYTGAQPATPQTAASGTLLATVTLVDPVGSIATGVLTITDSASTTGVAAGTAGWFRVADNSGDAVYDGAVGATGSGLELELSTTTISVGVTVDLGALTITVPQ